MPCAQAVERTRRYITAGTGLHVKHAMMASREAMDASNPDMAAVASCMMSLHIHTSNRALTD